MKQIFSQGGSVLVEDVPAPMCGENEVLVRTARSLISAGTETVSLQGSGKGYTNMASIALNNPELISKAVEMAKKKGLLETIRYARGQTDKLNPLGYSCSGTVIEVGKNILDIAVGDRVACAGAGYANHAEIVSIPRNLICSMPEDVSFEEAAFTTIGAIALQGIRRAQVQLGDTVAIIGLGLLGQIACQILKTAGAHVIGIEMMQDRLDLAKELGADICFTGGKGAIEDVLKYTNGIGADTVIIYAATESSEPIQQAMQMARKKGRVVVVGAVGMNIERSPFYEKELDFLISCSYGPGRYDPSYEEKGIDYPIGYVRWTENRNMEEFLRMLSEGKVNVKPLISQSFPIEEAERAYEELKSEKRPIGVLFNYEHTVPIPFVRKTQVHPITTPKEKINIALIGAGGFAQAYHLPNLKKIPTFHLKAIVTRSGNTAKKIADQYGAEYCTTDFREVLEDADIDMVVIATRHNLHAPLIIEAANAGKHIFVEKPIAMTYPECNEVYRAVQENDINLVIDFNRRFSPFGQKAKKITEKRKNPLIITYRINSAGMKKEHWINDPVEGGGAIIGEGCHFFDFCNWIVGYDPAHIYGEMISSNDQSLIGTNNIVCTIKYTDGSVASLQYATIGSESYSKERFEIFCDNSVIVVDDFKECHVKGIENYSQKLNRIEKGHFELLDMYGTFLKNGKLHQDVPSVVDGVKGTICSLKVIDALKTGEAQKWDTLPWS